MNKEEILINTQFALFFEQPLIRPDLLVTDFNEKIGDIFDQAPLTLPVPDELLDVPIVKMDSSNRVYSCNIARSRADFFHRGVGKQKFLDIKEDFQNEVEKFYGFFSQKSKIKRIGFVTRFFFEDERRDETIAKLINKDFKKLHNGSVREAYIRYASRMKLDDFEVNNFTSIGRFPARRSGVGDNIKGILITRDFNTIPEENYSSKLDKEKIKKFINDSEERFYLEKIKNLLW